MVATKVVRDNASNQRRVERQMVSEVKIETVTICLTETLKSTLFHSQEKRVCRP